MDIEQSLQAVRDIYVNAPRQMESDREQLTKVDREILDLLHVIELVNFNARDGFKINKQLQKARQERRKLKDELELLEPIKGLATFAKPTEKNINKALGDVRKN